MKLGILALAFVMSASVAGAQSIVCKVNSTGDGFIPEVIGMRLDQSAKQAVVFDAYINWARGEPINARVRTMTNGHTELSWNLTLPTRPIRARVTYRAILPPDRKTVIMRATMRNADNSPSGNGTCAAQEF